MLCYTRTREEESLSLESCAIHFCLTVKKHNTDKKKDLENNIFHNLQLKIYSHKKFLVKREIQKNKKKALINADPLARQNLPVNLA